MNFKNLINLNKYNQFQIKTLNKNSNNQNKLVMLHKNKIIIQFNKFKRNK